MRSKGLPYLSSNCLSYLWPLTFCPTPVPFTRRPNSTRFRIRSSVALWVNGSSSSTPWSRASLTSSACRRIEYFGLCQLPVTACFVGAKGFGVSSW